MNGQGQSEGDSGAAQPPFFFLQIARQFLGHCCDKKFLESKHLKWNLYVVDFLMDGQIKYRKEEIELCTGYSVGGITIASSPSTHVLLYKKLSKI